MSKIATLMQQAAAGAVGEALAIEDVFSTYLYTGNRTARDIVNGIDLAGEGGMVWTSARNVVDNKRIWDSERGANKDISTNSTAAQFTRTGALTAFNADGFSLGTDLAGVVNANSGETYASWTFRKAPRFFDVVTYTGNDVAGRQIAHNLGIEPGMIIVKGTNVAGDQWSVYHRSLTGNGYPAEQNYLFLNSTQAIDRNNNYWSYTAPTSTDFTVGAGTFVNTSGHTYVAYLFAHDPLGPSGDGSDGLIACGSYTGNGSTNGPEINLGWEPQWLLIKNATTSGYSWVMFDTMRGIVTGGDEQFFRAESSNAEGTFDLLRVTATGFKLDRSDGSTNFSGNNYIYIAIRRGPMREPTSGTEVFALGTSTSDNSGYTLTSNFPVDSYLYGRRSGADHGLMSRITNSRLLTPSTGAEASMSGFVFWDSNVNVRRTGLLGNASTVDYAFRRAPGFFDVVAYTGDGGSTVIRNHNLAAQPELVIVKSRGSSQNWAVAYRTSGTTYLYGLELNTTSVSSATTFDYGASMSATTFNSFVGSNINQSETNGVAYIAYLFATLPGISKIGSYTGNGTSQTIDCGFTSGARFVLIKGTSSNGYNWNVYDTARGIVAGNDPRLALDTTFAEVTSVDDIDPHSSGFSVTSTADVNASGETYIYLAIA